MWARRRSSSDCCRSVGASLFSPSKTSSSPGWSPARRPSAGTIQSREAMTFIHPLLLGGLLLLGLPIVIHLIMRQQPKHLLFPALRFLKLQQRTNQRKLRLRHLLLLLLRMLLIALMCLALARPRLFSDRLRNFLGSDQA